MGLLKAIVGGTVGLVVGTMTCAPITGMIGGAFVAQDWEQFNKKIMCKRWHENDVWEGAKPSKNQYKERR